MSDPADTQRLIGDVVRLGTVLSVDLDEATCRLQIGDIETGDLPWATASAGDVTIWSPPAIGEQRELLCPEGDMEAGYVGRAIYSDANPPPANVAGLLLLQFADGAILSYDFTAHALVAMLPAGATAQVTAPGGLTITGPVTITGDVAITGKATATDDMKVGAISLKSHKHSGVVAGGGKTLVPE